MHVRRYLPDRTGAQATINQQLGQRQKTQLCVAGGDELIGLRNAVALHQLALQRLQQTQVLQGLQSSSAIGREFGVGHRQALELTTAQHRALRVDQAGLRTPQHQVSGGVGPARAGHAQAFSFQPGRCLSVCRQQHLKGCALLDLRVQLAGRAQTNHRLVPRVTLKGLGNLAHRPCEVSRHCHANFGSL